MRNLIDEIFMPEGSEPRVVHRPQCGCTKCKAKILKHVHQSEDGELFDWAKAGYDNLVSALKRNFQCAIEDLTKKARPRPDAISLKNTPRDTSKIDAVVLHQMAFSRGSSLEKYLSVTSHFIIMPDGKIGQLHPFPTYLNASNTFNRRSVAIEFAGNFPNAQGKCWSSEKHGCHQVTQQQIDAGKCLLAHLKEKIPTIKYVFAHRQSSATRANDPGPDLWKNVGEWAISNLGYSPDGRSHYENGGKPIPDNWINT